MKKISLLLLSCCFLGLASCDLTGPIGPQGEKGDTGEKGEDGVSVLSIKLSSTINNVDTYIITYSDGATSTFKVTNGKDGQQGIQGIPGKDGHSPVISIGEDGCWCLDGVSTNIIAKGEKGDKGDKGEDGVSVISKILTSSVDNVDIYTITYSNGTTSVFKITNGINGQQGIQGIPGKDGHSPVISIGEDGYWYVDGISTKIKAKGEKGDKGEKGEDGTSLLTGLGTPSDLLGNNGDSYIDTQTWEFYIKANDKWTKSGNIKGDTGEKGEDGVSVSSIKLSSTINNVDIYIITYSDGTTSTFKVTNGKDGQQGIQGIPGKDGHNPVISIGEDGYWYVDGISTNIEAKGEKGDKGEKGEDGVSVISIILTSSVDNVDIYTITYSNGTTSVFKITNGINGQQGIQGIPGKDGHSPVISIGEDGYWYVDGISTNIRAKGEKGEKGETGSSLLTGLGIPSDLLGNNGDSYIDTQTWDYYIKTDGKWMKSGNIKGEKGEGGVSIVKSYIDENGHLICIMSNGSVIDTGVIKEVAKHEVRYHVGSELYTETVEHGSKLNKPDFSYLEKEKNCTIGNQFNFYDGDASFYWIFSAFPVIDDLDLYIDMYFDVTFDASNDKVDNQFFPSDYHDSYIYGREYSLPQLLFIDENHNQYKAEGFLGWYLGDELIPQEGIWTYEIGGKTLVAKWSN